MAGIFSLKGTENHLPISLHIAKNFKSLQSKKEGYVKHLFSVLTCIECIRARFL